MRIQQLFQIAVLSGGLLANACFGTVIFQDDFNTDPIGGDPSPAPWNIREFETTNRFIDVLGDGGNLFGEGVSNRFIRLIDNDPQISPPGDYVGVGASDACPATPVLTLSFDYYEPSGGLSDPFGVRFLSAGAPAITGNGNFRYSFNFDDGALEGALGAYSLDAEHRIDIVLNNQDVSIMYLGGTETIDPRSADIWVDGVLRIADASRSSFGTVTGIGFLSGSTSLQESFFDNVQVEDQAIVTGLVPEPGTAGLLFAGLGLLTVLRRKK
ncbi:MAG: PEP-CTERM sorting domain-containing protein [Verrucomicrobiota bacterium]